MSFPKLEILSGLIPRRVNFFYSFWSIFWVDKNWLKKNEVISEKNSKFGLSQR